MITSTPATRESHARNGRLDDAIASFVNELHTAGYAKESVRNKRSMVRRFAAWLRRGHLTVDAIDESHVAAFLHQPPGTLPARLKYKHAALAGFVTYLRAVRTDILHIPARVLVIQGGKGPLPCGVRKLRRDQIARESVHSPQSQGLAVRQLGPTR